MPKVRLDDGEKRRWHLSWILPGVIAVVLTWATAAASISMFPLCVVIVIGIGLAVVSQWLITPRLSSPNIGVSVVLVLSGAFGIWWTISNDRPIIVPKIGGVATQNYLGDKLGLDIEVNLQNQGRQSSYAKNWEAELEVDGRVYNGRMLVGQRLFEGATSLSEIRDQEFPPGKPVSGWLFFGFPDLQHSIAEPYFDCGSSLSQRAAIKVRVTDSKEGRTFSSRRTVGEMGSEVCSHLAGADER